MLNVRIVSRMRGLPTAAISKGVILFFLNLYKMMINV